MTGRADLLAAFPGSFTAGGDSPGIVAPTTRDEVAELVTRCVVELGPDVDEFLEVWNGDEWHMLIVVHPRHRDLLELGAWVAGLPDDDGVILLVADAAPAPPAVFVVERDHE